jgi:uncharacterized repeat protein (TIGR01451 family)
VGGSDTYAVTDNAPLGDTNPGNGAAPGTVPTGGATALTWGNWTLGNGDVLVITFSVNVGTTAGTYDNTASARATAGATTFTVTDIGTTGDDMGTPLALDPEPDEDVTVGLTITGRAWLDDGTGGATVGDGQRTNSEPGQPNVIVNLLDSTGTNVLQTILTDASGNYTFSGLAANTTYVVEFGLPPVGYATTLQDQGADATDSDVNPATRRVSVPLTTVAVSNVDAGFVPRASIGDRIWLDLDGDGTQDTNEPGLSGVIVELSNGVCVVGSTCSIATTDAYGNYTFADLLAGTYTVIVRTSSLPVGVNQTGDPDATLNNQHTLTVTAPGTYVDVDFGYQGTGSISNYVWNDTDNGGDQDAGETGIAGVTVWVDLDNDGTQDTGEPIDVTDASGLYTISGLYQNLAGYTVRAAGAPISGATPTYDLNGVGTPNVATVTLNAGQARTDVDWGYRFATLDITKASNIPGNVNPGDTIQYTINVINNTLVGQTNIAITDLLPLGTTYVAQSTVATGYNFTLVGTVGDAFNTNGVYTGNQDSNGAGTDPSWNPSPGTWTQVVEVDGAAAGDIQVIGNRLRIQGNGSAAGEGVYRDVDISSCTTAVLSFSYQRVGLDNVNDYVRLRIGPSGTLTANLADFAGPTNDGSAQPYSVDITNWLSNQTRIELRSANDANMLAADQVFFDDVLISCYTTAAATRDNIPAGLPNLADGVPSNLVVSGDNFALAPGQSMTVQYNVTVNNPATLNSINNTASVVSTQQLTPRYASISDPVTLRAVIGDRVWLDEDGNGLQDAGEAGIPNVRVFLDTNNDGIYDAGETFTYTDADGGYLFKNLAPASYNVAVDATSLPAGLANATYDENDGTVTPNGRTPVTVTSGQEYVTADFGYNAAPSANVNGNTSTGAIGNRLWIDADGDGVQDPGEPGMGGVTVRLLTDNNGDGVYGGAGDNPATSTTTDAAGNYLFAGLAAGGYIVEVNNGIAPTDYTQTGDPDQPGALCTTCDNRTTTPITLAPGDVYVNADFGYQPNANIGATIGDTLWVDTDLDNAVDAGEPALPGVTVALIRDLNENGAWDAGEPIIASDVTDVNGQYAFTGVPVADGVGTDDYLVWVNDTANILQGLAANYDANGANPVSGLVTGLGISTMSNLLPAGDLNQDFAYVPLDHATDADSDDGLIGDTIYLDRDGGLDYDTGEGLEGVTVNLYRDTNADGNYDAGEPLVASVNTNENGQYFFADLPAGNYVVQVETSTLPSGLINTVDPDTSSSPLNESGLTLAAGGVNLAQDFGYDGTNTISGTLWRDTDAAGDLDAGEAGRFANITVVLRDSSGDIIATATTDASGNYTFANLPDGTYTVDVTDDANLLDGYWKSTGATPGADNNSQADPYIVTVSGLETNATADFGYYRETSAIGDFVWNDANNNGNQDGGETGIANVQVTLTITWPGGAGTSTLNTTTDASGNYSFGNVLADEDFDGAAPGSEPTFSVSVVTPSGYIFSPIHAGAANVDSGNPAGEPAAPTEGSSDLNADFGFYIPPVTIGNAVWLDENGDGVQDAGEAGIANITVRLCSDAACTSVLQTTTTDANGGYAFKNVAPGSYYVDVLNSSLPTGLVQTAVIGGTADFTGKADPFAVTVLSGQENLTADFGFNYAPPADTDGNLNTGAIGDRLWIDDGDGVQEPGEPGLYNITVDLLTAGPDGILGTADDVVAATTTSAYDGSYIFDGLAAGAYVVRVNGGAAPAGYTLTGDPDSTLDNRTTTPILLAPGDVYVNADFGYTPTGNAGNIGNLLWLDTNRNNADDGSASEPRLPGVTVSLIRDLDGDGVWDAGEPIIATDITDSAGTYTFTNLPVTDGVGSDDYLVWVNDTENTLSELTPTYDSNGVSTPNISVVTDLTTSGIDTQDFAYAPYGHDAGEGFIGDTIFYDRDSSGTPVAGEGMEGVRVELYQDVNNNNVWDAGDTLLATTFSNENGRYFFGGLAAGEYVVRVDASTLPTGVTNTVDPDAASPGDNQSAITLAAGGSNVVQDFGYRDTTTPNTVSGTLWRDTNANGVLNGAEAGRFENVTIVLKNSSGNLIATTTTDASGNYSFANLPDGTFTVHVSDDTNVLNGYWKSTGTAGSDNNSQLDPYSVTVPVTPNTTADFGFYRDPAAIGDRVWNDANGNGIQDAGETGLPGIAVVLTITYPNASVVTLRTTTDASGNYTFGNLLADEDFDGVGGALVEPTFVITVTPPSGYAATLSDVGVDTTDSDGLTITALPVEGTTNTSYDAGLVVGATIGNAIWLDENGDGSRDAGEPGLPNITVRLCSDAACASVLQTTVSDAEGGYTFKNVATGSYYVDVLDSSLPTGLVQTTVIGGTADNTNKADAFNLAVTAGSEVLYADFGYNYAPSADTDGNINTGAIGDRLWTDDGDGLQEPGEPGLYNVTVDLLTAGPDGILGTADDVVAATTTSAPDGSYIFDGLVAGAYVVRVNGGAAPAGYTLTGDPDSTLDNRTTTPIFLAPGDVYVNADFGYTPTGNAGNIGDTLWLDADRDNVDDGAASEPRLPGVSVALIRDLNSNGSWDSGEPIIAQDVTDANGNYLFTNVPASGTEDYLVWVNDTENVLFGLNPTFDSNGAATPNLSAITDLTSAGNLNQDFAYAPLGHDAGEGLIGDTIFYDRNSTGTPQAGEGMEGARVYLYQDNNNDGNYDAGETLLATAWTNENGQYFFGGLPAGDYVVLVDTTTLPSSLFNTVDPDTLSSPASEAGITLAAGGINLTQDFGYQESTPLSPNTVSGTLWRDSDTDGVLDAAETTRFAGVTVVLRTTSGNIIAATTTDASGNYTFNLVPDGTFIVDVTDDANVLNGTWHSLGTAGSDNNSQVDPYSVSVNSGQTNTTGDFGYYRETSSVGNFVWRDTDGDGIQDGGETGLAGVEVILTITYPNASVVTLHTTTDASGNYTFGNVLLDEDFDGAGAGEPLFSVSIVVPNGYTPSPVDAGGNDATDSDNPLGVPATPTEAAPDNNADFGLIAGAGVIGDRIWLDEDSDGLQDAGEPGIANVTVELRDGTCTPGSTCPTTVTDSEGRYRFSGVAAGTYTLAVINGLPAGLAANPTYDEDGVGTANTSAATITPGQEYVTADFGYNWAATTDVNTLTPPLGATGAIGDRLWIDANGDGVQDPGEAGLGGVAVTLLTPGSDGVFGTSDDVTTANTTSDAAGHYIFDDLAAGAYVIRIAPPGGYTPTGDPDLLGTICTICDNRTTTPILLAPGDVYVNADFGYAPDLGNGGSSNMLGNQIFLDADGNGVFGGSDTGIPGISVSVIRDVVNDGVWDPDGADNTLGTADDEAILATDLTDPSGQYSFPGLPNGSYIVWVNDTANILGGLAQTSTPNNAADNGQVCGSCNGRNAVTVTGTGNNYQDFGYAPTGHGAGDGLIGDTIFLDRDGGNDYDPGEGLEGVGVRLFTDTNGDGNYDAGEPLVATTVSDENGHYAFGNLLAGNYVVQVDTATLPAGVTNTVDVGDATLNEGGLALAAGGVNLAQDFGYRDTTAPNTISGTIWRDSDADGTLDGTETGRLAGVTVAIYNSSGNLVGATTTDGNGDYSFPNLPDGTYRVDVTDDANLLNGSWHSRGTNGVDGDSQADPYSITVPATPNTTADFGYYRDPSQVGDFIWLDRMAFGTLGIQDTGSEPGIKGITVTLTINYPSGDSAIFSVRTGPGGSYSFGNLLLDENYNLSDGTAARPIYIITVSAVPNGTASPTGLGTATTDSNGASMTVNPLARGQTDSSYDSGFYTDRIDLGDLPDNIAGYPDYATVFSPGPANTLFPDTNADGQPETFGGIPAVWLGLRVDSENDGFPAGNARGDDTNNLSDEDGLNLLRANWLAGQSSTMTVTVNSDGHGVRVHYAIWIDWATVAATVTIPPDGTFDSFYTGSLPSGSPADAAVTVAVPANYPPNGSVYIRVRASDQPLTFEDYQGTLVNGETEDYLRQFTPTSVEVAELRAVPALPPTWLLAAAALLLLVSLGSVAALAYARQRK